MFIFNSQLAIKALGDDYDALVRTASMRQAVEDPERLGASLQRFCNWCFEVLELEEGIVFRHRMLFAARIDTDVLHCQASLVEPKHACSSCSDNEISPAVICNHKSLLQYCCANELGDHQRP